MLNGLDPIIIFNFRKRIPLSADLVAKIPFVSTDATYIPLPPIPIYLSESLTGIVIKSEDKNIDVETKTESKTDGTEPDVKQKAVGSGISVNLEGKKTSLGLALLSAVMDQLYEKVSSEEYDITYLHGPVTVFRGKLQHYSATQSAENDLLIMKIDISKGAKDPVSEPSLPVVPKSTGGFPL